ncbi:hypothetical protein ACFX13_003666 [Malus domestica]
MAMAWRLPTQLATPGNLHHNDSKTPSFEASLSWCRTLAPDHLLPMSKSSTSTATALCRVNVMCSCVGEQADLSKPETIIDCATGHPEEPIKKIGWEGKVALIQCVKAMGIQKFVFYSIHNCDKHPEVPLMDIKYFTEKFLQDSGINYIIIHLCGFMQVRFT